ncbi:MAG: hypothetical protein O7F73_10105 [Gammaproteobacteria bacterium]|nr:hypothetical protein [Gammaproteobacteria bacterium]
MGKYGFKARSLSPIIAALGLVVATFSHAGPRDQARRIHDRLTGVPPTDAMLDVMTSAIAGGTGGAKQAALYAMDGAPGVVAAGDFYTVTLKNWATPWTNEDQDPFAALNDYSATVIGVVRDDLDFREVLSGDIIYTGSIAGIPPYAPNNNDHYKFLEAAGANLGDDSLLVANSQSSVTGFSAVAVAGVMTTRAAARAFFVDGTNRAMFRFTLLNYLCMDLEQLKDTSRPSDRIRQDVSRSPGGDSTLFLNQCVGCHSGMDPMAQAYAYYDFPYPEEQQFPNLSEDERKDLGQMVYSPNLVQDKYLINSATFAPGYVTPNDHWSNYWRLGENSARIGWRNAPDTTSAIDLVANAAFSEGDGAASLGWELANSEAFSWCQVKKVFRNVCLREPEPDAGETNAVAGFVATFNSSHSIKQVFAEVAGYCSSHL